MSLNSLTHTFARDFHRTCSAARSLPPSHAHHCLVLPDLCSVDGSEKTYGRERELERERGEERDERGERSVCVEREREREREREKEKESKYVERERERKRERRMHARTRTVRIARNRQTSDGHDTAITHQRDRW
jgi:hypothetical protein